MPPGVATHISSVRCCEDLAGLKEKSLTDGAVIQEISTLLLAQKKFRNRLNH